MDSPFRADRLYWVTRRVDSGKGVLYVCPLPEAKKIAFSDEAGVGVYLGDGVYQLVLVLPDGDFAVFAEGRLDVAPAAVAPMDLAAFKRKAWDAAEKFLKAAEGLQYRLRAYRERVAPDVDRRVVITGVLDDADSVSPA